MSRTIAAIPPATRADGTGLLPWAILTVLVLVGAAGCRTYDGPRLPPFPSLDPGDAVPGAVAPAGAESQSTPTAYRARLEGSRTPQDDQTLAASPTVLPLSVGLTAELPASVREWRRATYDGITVLAHSAPDGSPDALVLTFDAPHRGEASQSTELRGFLVAMDPSLAVSPGDEMWGLLPDRLPVVPGVSSAALRDAFRRSISPTLGLGIGFRAAPDGFKGWRHVGDTNTGVRMRLARVDGMWGAPLFAHPPSPLPPADAFPAALRPTVQQLQEVTASGGGRPLQSAWMLVGMLEAPGSPPTYLAMLCRTTPTCPVSVDLATLLRGVRPRGPTDRDPPSVDGADLMRWLDLEHVSLARMRTWTQLRAELAEAASQPDAAVDPVPPPSAVTGP